MEYLKKWMLYVDLKTWVINSSVVPNMLHSTLQSENSGTLVGILNWSWDRSCWFEKVSLFTAVVFVS